MLFVFGSKSAKKIVVYKGLVSLWAKKHVNINISISKNNQNIVIYNISCFPYFLEIAKTA